MSNLISSLYISRNGMEKLSEWEMIELDENEFPYEIIPLLEDYILKSNGDLDELISAANIACSKGSDIAFNFLLKFTKNYSQDLALRPHRLYNYDQTIEDISRAVLYHAFHNFDKGVEFDKDKYYFFSFEAFRIAIEIPIDLFSVFSMLRTIERIHLKNNSLYNYFLKILMKVKNIIFFYRAVDCFAFYKNIDPFFTREIKRYNIKKEEFKIENYKDILKKIYTYYYLR
ncbi:hypothetical protein ACWA5Z_04090 [Testudinibacter sp. P80/BLE/0925]|uniref:hypothetical protein n=1 Tax=Testudinibacter sp. TW-1 TaxID=3417757 RepID=UPI003D35DF20